MLHTQVIQFRELSMNCCSAQISWVGTRLPNYCPECGARSLDKLGNLEAQLLAEDNHCVLYIHEVK